MATEPPMPAAPSRSDPDHAAVDFDHLYRREWADLLALGWSLTGSWTVAEDLAQDAFADAYRRWDHVATLDRPGAWVRRAIINRSVSQHRRTAVARRGDSRVVALRSVDDDSASTDRTGDAAAARVGDPAFWAAVRSLPGQQRACVALHYLEDRPVAEIADILGCRPATVKVHLHRGRHALAAALASLRDAEHTDRRDPSPPVGRRERTDHPDHADHPDHSHDDRTEDDR